MNDEEATKLGRQVIGDVGNPVIRAFAAELIGESYPLSEEMTAAVFDGRSVNSLGRSFAKWVDEVNEREAAVKH